MRLPALVLACLFVFASPVLAQRLDETPRVAVISAFPPEIGVLNAATGEQKTYDVDPSRAASFYARIRTYWPGLPDGSLVPDYAGIRPKLTGPGEPAADFMIEGPAEHGMAGLINLFGIESPGLTSSLPLADDVVSYLDA